MVNPNCPWKTGGRQGRRRNDPQSHPLLKVSESRFLPTGPNTINGNGLPAPLGNYAGQTQTLCRFWPTRPARGDLTLAK